MNRALFLDRDGVINVNTEGKYCNRVEDFHLVPGILELCRAYVWAGYKIIVVTNQAGVARGFLTAHALEHIHNHMVDLFVAGRCAMTAVYYCHHHPDSGCSWRKPEPGMLLQAQREHNIDMAASILIGDNITDIEAGRRAGVGCCILVPSGRLDAVPLPR